MATLNLAVVVCIFVLVKDTDAQAAGERCINGACDDPTGNGGAIICEEGTSICKMNAGLPCNRTTPCLSGDHCEDGTCKIRVDGSCFSGVPEPNCIAHAECPNNKCLCKKDFTANREKTVCEVEPEVAGCGDSGPCVTEAAGCGNNGSCVTEAAGCGNNGSCVTEAAGCGNNGSCVTEAAGCGNNGSCVTEAAGCGDKGPCASNAICEDSTCKIKMTAVDEECGTADKACDPTTLVCQDKHCKKKIEQDCSTTEECVAGAECPSQGVKQCSCTGAHAATPDMTKCGAMGIAASMMLVVATFVTSRFL